DVWSSDLEPDSGDGQGDGVPGPHAAASGGVLHSEDLRPTLGHVRKSISKGEPTLHPAHVLPLALVPRAGQEHRSVGRGTSEAGGRADPDTVSQAFRELRRSLRAVLRAAAEEAPGFR